MPFCSAGPGRNPPRLVDRLPPWDTPPSLFGVTAPTNKIAAVTPTPTDDEGSAPAPSLASITTLSAVANYAILRRRHYNAYSVECPQAPPMTMTSSTLSVYGVEVVVSLSPFELSPRPRAGWPRGAETAKGTGFTRPT